MSYTNSVSMDDSNMVFNLMPNADFGKNKIGYSWFHIMNFFCIIILT